MTRTDTTRRERHARAYAKAKAVKVGSAGQVRKHEPEEPEPVERAGPSAPRRFSWEVGA